MSGCSNVAMWSILILAVVWSGVVEGDPEPMARPTRPKVFTSPEELRRYLDHVRDYYSLNGKARYGKRSEEIPTARSDGEHAWDVVRSIVDVHRQMQQKYASDANKERLDWVHEVGQAPDSRHIRLPSRPAYLLDVIEKYYDDAQ